MKKIIIVLAVLAATMCFAAPHNHSHAPKRPPVVHRSPAPRHAAPPKHHYHHSSWGHGGKYFWPSFTGSLLGSALISSVEPRTVVIEQPVIVGPLNQPSYTLVWVEGRYISQIQPNGTVIRVWQPGHYEQILVK